MRSGRLIFLLILLLAAMALPARALSAGNTYYVDPSGSDESPGTLGSPWRTIQHAVDSAGAGDTILVREGTYAEAVGIASGGSSGSPLAISAYSGESPVLVGGGSEWAGFQFAPGTSWVDIEGIAIDSFRIGIDVSGGNSHISLTDLEVSGSEVGMRMTWGYSGDEPMFGPVDHVAITGSSFHDNHFSGIDCTPGPCDDISLSGVDITDNGVGAQSFGADGLAVERGARISISELRSINNGGDGVDLNSRDGGPVEGITVSRSIVANNQRNGMKLWAGGRIENCLVYGTGFNPLPLASFSNVTVELVNNTIAMNMWDPSYAVRDYAMTVGYQEGETPLSGISLTMINNVFAFNTGPDVGSPTGIYLASGVSLAAENNNIYYSRDDCEILAAFTGQGCYTQADISGGDWAQDTGRGSGDQAADPLFTDAAGADFHLLPQSPGLNAGSSTGAPAVDIAGRQRPRGGAYDIGAYEGGGAWQPELTWTCDGTYWASYADFSDRILSVDYSLDNEGPGGALSLGVTGWASSHGTKMTTPLPLSLGSLNADAGTEVTLRYLVPQGVSSFRTITRLTGTDAYGEEFTYPGQD